MAGHYIQKFQSVADFLARSADRSIAAGLGYFNGVVYANVGGTAVGIIPVAGQDTTALPADGVLRSFVNASGVGNGADSTDDQLDTYNIPAKAFNAVTGSQTQRVIGSAWGTTAANVNTKTLKLKMGASTVTLNPTTTAPNGKTWFLDYEIIRAGASAQVVVATLSFAGVAAEAVTFVLNGAETDTAAIAVTLTGKSGSSAANDILLYSHQAQFSN